MVTAIGYLRVSTAEQAARGYGLKAQERSVRALVKRKGWRLGTIHRDEGASGSNGLDDRVGLAAVLAELEAGSGERVLAVHKLDRLARDLRLQLTIVARLEKAGVQVVSVEEPDVEDNDMREFIRNILGSMAQYERAVIRGRMAAGKAAKAAGGGYVGGRPGYGQRAVEGRLEAREDETAVVDLIRAQRAAGRSYREICADLEAAGHRPRGTASSDGTPPQWQPAVVRRVAIRAGRE